MSASALQQFNVVGAAAVVAALLLGFLLGAVAGCATTLIVQWRNLRSWERSLIRASLIRAFGRSAGDTGSDSLNVTGVTSGPGTRSFGSSNSSGGERHTSTSSQTTTSTKTGSRAAGGIASGEKARLTSPRAPTSRDFAAVTAALSRMPQNMPPKPSRKPCRPCEAIRAKFSGFFRAAGGG